jgi:hypothetical protein
MSMQIGEELHTLLSSNTKEAYENTIVSMFHLRDARGGVGVYSLFYMLMEELYKIVPDLALSLLPLIPEYGSWEDMFRLASTFPPFKHTILDLAEKQLEIEEKRLNDGEPLSMFAKWVPDEKKSKGALAVEFAHRLARNLPSSVRHSQIMRSYRRRINRLNAVVAPVEIYECANRWDEIDPTKVSAGAIKKKWAAYLNRYISNPIQRSNDTKRIECAKKFEEFFEERSKTPIEYKMHTPESSRYDMVRRVLKEWMEGGWRV